MGVCAHTLTHDLKDAVKIVNLLQDQYKLSGLIYYLSLDSLLSRKKETKRLQTMRHEHVLIIQYGEKID